MLGLVTCLDAAAVDTDLPPMTALLPDAMVVAWDDATVDWSLYDTVVIRSTWNYVSRHDEFLGWLRTVDAVTRVWNPVAMIEWNADKRYLADLAAAALPVVPTWFVEPGDDLPALDDLDDDLVVKPTVGGGSQGVLRSTGAPERARDHIALLLAAGRAAMVQPYRHQIDVDGETGLVYLGGDFSHAFEKAAILAGELEWEHDLFVKETVRARTPSAAQRALADTVVASVGPTAYARVDLVPGDDGPELLELELVEPSLFLHTDPTAPERAAAVFAALGE